MKPQFIYDGYEQWLLMINDHNWCYDHWSIMINDHDRGYEHRSLWSLIILIHAWMYCSCYDRLLIIAMICWSYLWTGCRSCMITYIIMSSWTLSWPLVWKVSGGVWKVSGGCLGVSEGCQEHVLGWLRDVVVWRLSGVCLEGAWKVSGGVSRYLEGVWGCLEGHGTCQSFQYMPIFPILPILPFLSILPVPAVLNEVLTVLAVLLLSHSIVQLCELVLQCDDDVRITKFFLSIP